MGTLEDGLPELESQDMDRRSRARLFAACGFVVVGLGACGSSMTLTEYANELERAAVAISQRFSQPEAVLKDTNATLEEARSALKETATIRRDFHEQLSGIDPPEEMAELHALLIAVHADIVDAQQAWADSADSAASVAELTQSAEAQTLVEVGETGFEVCRQMQAAFDATRERAIFEGTPWLPTEMTESIEVAFGCA